MKKTLSLVLCLLVAFSMFTVAASAVDTVKVEFYSREGALIGEAVVEVGTNLTSYVPAVAKEFSVDTEGEKGVYTFKGWTTSPDGKGSLYYDSTLPTPTGDQEVIKYYAQYSFEDQSSNQSFWQLIQSIFARFNLIFEYFATIFNW